MPRRNERGEFFALQMPGSLLSFDIFVQAG
jgi:hypothetical protein